MKHFKIEKVNYTVDNTEFIKFCYETKSENAKEICKERFYIYKYLQNVDWEVNYTELQENTFKTKNQL